MLRIACVGLIVAALAPQAFANGRNPGTSTLHFRHGAETDIIAGMTFGVVISHDNGATWHWECEAAVGYAGTYDPDYDWGPGAAPGSLFATTFAGLKDDSDGCTYANSPSGTTFVSQVEIGPDGAVYYAASDPADIKIYKSTNDGVSFTQSATPPGSDILVGTAYGTWWDSLVISPSNAMRVYLSGYLLTAGQPRTQFLYRSDDGGATFTAMVLAGITTTNNTAIDFVAVDPTNPDIAYVRVKQESAMGEGLYKTTNGGASGSWTHMLSENDSPLSLVVRADGSLVAGSPNLGMHTSPDGTTWTDLVNPPHINCLAHNAADEVWACTANFDVPGGPPKDGYGIMKSSGDLSTWTPVLRFQDIMDPVACPAGTVQEDQCVLPYMAKPSVWCALMTQLGITSTSIPCASFNVDGAVDGAPVVVPPKGCCDTSGGGTTSALVLGGFIMLILGRRKRR